MKVVAQIKRYEVDLNYSCFRTVVCDKEGFTRQNLIGPKTHDAVKEIFHSYSIFSFLTGLV